MPQPVVAIEQLVHRYESAASERPVLGGVSLVIYPGEIVVLTGPSGCGKTTLLTLVGALRSAQTGSLQVFGKQLVAAAPGALVAIRRRIGYIFQAHNLLSFLSARQNVQMALELHSTEMLAERSAAMLTAVGLADKLAAYPENLSGGQKQRVAIARALVNRPPLVLADEPTASLDSASGRAAVELLRDLAREQGTAVLLVTHDSRIHDIADRLVRMEDGLIVGGGA
ncbi:ATP-binding cassette domain-containing protein [Gloeobacter morelensis]|uniref:ATP-binding cassette domain-containing protein n=1 Tax=Gloeobacter morelensis MG652769 TaxID=2781736 RepID=A0ABY3PN66_9CYAN|nr:ATP-binding cassette domain-containing protein [Gloeobacter morelensis]UFP95138.1 ATP-binding cassette domain-containing protein [Gloeobacter morelensis MG652769]